MMAGDDMTTQPDRLMAGEKSLREKIAECIRGGSVFDHDDRLCMAADIMALLLQSSPGEDREQIRREALEEAAKVARYFGDRRGPRISKTGQEISEAIEALISTPPREQEQK